MTPEEFATLNRYLQTPQSGPLANSALQPTRVPVFAAPDPTGVQAAANRGMAAIHAQMPATSQAPTQTPASTSNPQAYAMQYFISRGYSPQAAAGVVAGLSGENLRGDYTEIKRQPTERGGAINPQGAYGIAQLNGPRQQGLIDYAAKTGGDIRSLDTQLGHVDYELQHSYPQTYQSVISAPSSQHALSAFVSGYEVPKNISGQIQARSSFLPTLENMASAGYQKVADLGHAAYDKGAAAVNYVKAAPGQLYDAGVHLLSPSPAPSTQSTSGWRDASGNPTATPFGATNYQGMSAGGALMSGLAHPLNIGQGGILPTILNGVTHALAQLFGVTPAEASPAQKQVAVQAVQQQSAPATQPQAAPQMQPIAPVSPVPSQVKPQPQGTTGYFARVDNAPQMGAPQPQLAFGQSPMPTGANVLGRPLAPDSTIMDPRRLGGAQDRNMELEPMTVETVAAGAGKPPNASAVPIPPAPSMAPPEPISRPPQPAPALQNPTSAPTMSPDNLFGLIIGSDGGNGLAF